MKHEVITYNQGLKQIERFIVSAVTATHGQISLFIDPIHDKHNPSDLINFAVTTPAAQILNNASQFIIIIPVCALVQIKPYREDTDTGATDDSTDSTDTAEN